MNKANYTNTIINLLNDYKEQVLKLAYDIDLTARFSKEKQDVNLLKGSIKNFQNEFNEILKIQNTLNLMAKFKDIK